MSSTVSVMPGGCGCRWAARPPGNTGRSTPRRLRDGAFELIVANAAHIKNVPGRKTDVNDATWIADLLACELIRSPHRCSPPSTTC
jgi:transposase